MFKWRFLKRVFEHEDKVTYTLFCFITYANTMSNTTDIFFIIVLLRVYDFDESSQCSPKGQINAFALNLVHLRGFTGISGALYGSKFP